MTEFAMERFLEARRKWDPDERFIGWRGLCE
jgi:hypothetical protein